MLKGLHGAQNDMFVECTAPRRPIVTNVLHCSPSIVLQSFQRFLHHVCGQHEGISAGSRAFVNTIEQKIPRL